VRIRRRHLVSKGKKLKLHIVEEVEEDVVHVFCLEPFYEEEVIENIPLSLDVRPRICKRCLSRAEKMRRGRG